MTALLVVLTAVVAVLTVLVAGLLRAYAEVLRRLHALDGGATVAPADSDAGFGTAGAAPGVPTVGAPVGSVLGQGPGPRRVVSSIEVEGRDSWTAAHDLHGPTLAGELATVRAVGVDHDTVIAFLSSGCEGCRGFWAELASPQGWDPPPGSRLVVVTKDLRDESPSELLRLAGRAATTIDVVHSSAAWADYAVPGAPFVVVVDGRTGRVKGHGSGRSFSQIQSLLTQAGHDLSHAALATAPDATRPRAGAGRTAVRKPRADVEREQDVDRLLLAAGIAPGHPSLYAPAEHPAPTAAEGTTR